MACRSVIRQVALHVGRRQRSTVAASVAPEAACPFSLRNKTAAVHEEQQTTISRAKDNAVANSFEAEEYVEIKPYSAIPTATGLPLVGTTLSILKHGGAAKMHEYIDMRHKQLGPIFKERLGHVEAVAVASKDLASDVYVNEGRYPQHLVPEPWLIYNKMRGIQRGLFFM